MFAEQAQTTKFDTTVFASCCVIVSQKLKT